jgi:hypothetical protein
MHFSCRNNKTLRRGDGEARRPPWTAVAARAGKLAAVQNVGGEAWRTSWWSPARGASLGVDFTARARRQADNANTGDVGAALAAEAAMPTASSAVSSVPAAPPHAPPPPHHLRRNPLPGGGLALNIARVISPDLIPQCSTYLACIQILVLPAAEDAVIDVCMYLLPS